MQTSKLNKVNRKLSFIVVFCLIASCATAPKEKQSATSPFTPAEVNIYQEALNDIKIGELDKATIDLNKLLQAHPTHLGVGINLATVYYKNKKIVDANRTLANVKKINSNISEAYNLLGLIDVENGQYNSAEKNYLAAINLKKDYATAHYNLALVYDIFYQDFDRAIMEYEQYLHLTGNVDKDTINWVAELKLKQKRRSN